MTAPSPEAMDVLLHTLGYVRGKHDCAEDRNVYVTAHDDAACAELVAAGLMHAGVRVAFLPADERMYWATSAGLAVAWAEHQRTRPPKLTAGQRRYRRWVEIRDVIPITFGDFLRSPHLHTEAR